MCPTVSAVSGCSRRLCWIRPVQGIYLTSEAERVLVVAKEAAIR